MKHKSRFPVACYALILIGSTACTTSPQVKEAKYLKRGQEQMAKKDYDRAALEFRTAAQAMPKDAEPYYQLGLAYWQGSNPAGAVAAFRQAAQLNPKHWGAQLKLAELMAGSRNKSLVEQAAAQLQAIIAASPENLEAIDTLAVTEMELGKPEDAARHLEESLEKFPADLRTSVTLARIRLARKDFAGAEEVLQGALASAPQSAQAALAMGQFYEMRREPAKAEPHIRQVLRIEPKNIGALAALGAIQKAGNRMGEADQTYKQLALLPPKSNRPSHAMFLFQTGHIPEALTELEKLVTDDAEDRAVRTRLVAMYVWMNKATQAQALLMAALKRNPKDTDALFQRSALYLKTGKLAEAGEDLRQALRLQPDSVEAHLGMAGIFRAEGLQNLETEELNTALRLQPGRLATRLNLVRNFLAANQSKAALDLLDKAPDSQNLTLAAVTERVWALLEAGDTKAAGAILDRALKAARVAETVLQEAVLRLQEHDYLGARLDAEEVLRGHPEDARAARIAVGSYAEMNEPRKALVRLTEIAAHRPKSAPIQSLLGEWYVRTGHLPEARKAFEAALAGDPAFLFADLALAEIDLRENRMAAARQRLAAVVAANPKNVSALLLIASADEAASDRAAAMARYQSILAVDSSNLLALNNLAYDLALEDPDRALPLAQRAVEMAPDNADFLDTLGWVYHRRGNYNSAIGYLKNAVNKQPTAQRQFHLAMAYLKSGQRDLGQSMMLTALQKDPNLVKTEHGW